MSKKFLVVDVAHVFWPVFKTCEKEDRLDDVPESAFDRLTSMIAEGVDPAGVFETPYYCAIDMPPYERSKMFDGYKANRPEKHPRFAELQEKFWSLIAFHNDFQLRGEKGMEADDVCAALAQKIVEAGHEVVIATRDKDTFQLVSEKVTVYSTAKGTLIGPDEVHSILGVWPDQVADYLALVGDRADGIPGCPGIGPEKAKEILAQYGTLPSLSLRAVNGELALSKFLGPKAMEALAAYNPQPALDLILPLPCKPQDAKTLMTLPKVEHERKLMNEPEAANDTTPAPSGNRDLWDSVSKTDAKYTKDFAGKGGFKGTAINATWLARQATKTFGPAGLGWGLRVLDEKYVTGSEGCIIHVLRVELWYMLGGKRGSIEQYGQTTFVGKNKSGPFTDEEAPKKSMTDAMSKCLSLLGFGADIHLGLYDDNKYVNDRQRNAGESDKA